MDKAQTAKLKKKGKNFGAAEYFNIATCNEHRISHKYQKLQQEMKNREINMAVITETKKTEAKILMNIQ
jgi:hypothetical protein